MKNRKLRKALMLVFSAMLLVAISVGATVAYLASTDEVVNTFTVGKVKITLDEADVYKYGQANIPEGKEHGDAIDGAARVKANDYKLFPGGSYDKDPTVHVEADSENCYVFVQVVNGIEAIEADTKIADQITANGWTELAVEGVEGKLYYKEHTKQDKVTDYEVFSKVNILGTVDNDTLANYANKTVKVTAYAIQKDGFESAADAWDAGNVSTANGGWLVEENTENGAEG